MKNGISFISFLIYSYGQWKLYTIFLVSILLSLSKRAPEVRVCPFPNFEKIDYHSLELVQWSYFHEEKKLENESLWTVEYDSNDQVTKLQFFRNNFEL